MRLLCLFFILIVSTSNSNSQTLVEAVPVSTECESLKVLSWNIYMLPRFARVSGKRKRAKAIAKLLNESKYDIVVFQEAFLKAARRILWHDLKNNYPYRIGPANKKPASYKTNSGIWMLSRIALTELGTVQYSQCEGPDCWARKGALLAEGKFNESPFQILGTHLEAGGPDEIKIKQYQEMEALLAGNRKEGIPQIICGDMNTKKDGDEKYSIMLSTLGCEDGPLEGDFPFTADGQRNDMNGGGPSNQKIIDYIFYRSNGVKCRLIRRCVPELRAQWHNRHKDLSDHFPVLLEICW